MENVLPPPDAEVARGPSAQALADAYANDPKIKSLTAGWERKDNARREKAQARLKAAMDERAPLSKQYQSIRQKVAGLNATIQIERQNAKARKMPAAIRNQIGQIKSQIVHRLRKEFLREKRIQFDQATKQSK